MKKHHESIEPKPSWETWKHSYHGTPQQCGIHDPISQDPNPGLISLMRKRLTSKLLSCPISNGVHI